MHCCNPMILFKNLIWCIHPLLDMMNHLSRNELQIFFMLLENTNKVQTSLLHFLSALTRFCELFWPGGSKLWSIAKFISTHDNMTNSTITRLFVMFIIHLTISASCKNWPRNVLISSAGNHGLPNCPRNMQMADAPIALKSIHHDKEPCDWKSELN